MKRTFALVALLLVTVSAFSQSVPLNMTFQGRLAKPDGTPLPDTTTQSLTFRLYDAATAGNKLWQQNFANSVPLHNGAFSVSLNFATGYTNGNSLATVFGNPLLPPYLEVQVGGATPLAPRQPFASVAYSLYAGTALSVPPNSITNADIVSVDWGKITNIPAGTFGWGLTGNAGTDPNAAFVGTTDSTPLTLKVNGYAAMRFAYAGSAGLHSVNVAGGSALNSITSGVVGGTIGGGGMDSNSGSTAPNMVTANFGTVSGGRGNSANGTSSTISGGSANTVSANFAAIGGGELNSITGHHATIPGGSTNVAAGNYNFAAGLQAQANHNDTFVWNDNSYGSFASTAPNQFLIHAFGGVGINTNAPQIDLDIAGGLSLDGENANRGVLDSNALHFGGAGTGEGIASNRNSGNQYGLDFFTNFTPRLSISNSGNVGIGATTPGIALDDAGGLSVDSAHANSGTLDGAALHFGGAGSGEGIASNRSGSNPYALNFYTNYTNRLSITNNGNIGIGTTTPQYTLDVHGTGNFTSIGTQIGLTAFSANGIAIGGYSLAGNGLAGVYGEDDNANCYGVYGTSANGSGVYGYSSSAAGVVGDSASIGVYGKSEGGGDGVRGYSNGGYAIFADGNAGGTTGWMNVSDSRYKTHVRTLPNALETVLALRGVNFEWRRSDFPERNFPEGPQVGFIAQEIEKFLPEIVHTDRNGYKSVAYASVVPVLVEAVKTQQQRLDTLQRDNDDLRTQAIAQGKEIAELKARLKRQEDIETRLKALEDALSPRTVGKK